MRTEVVKKLKEINTAIYEKKADPNNLGLINDFCGISLFTTIYDTKLTTSNINKDIDFILNHFESYIEKKNLNPHFADGISGIFWYLSYLNNKNIIKFSPKKYFADFDKYLDLRIMENSKAKNHDLFRGNIGIIMYYHESGLLEQKKELQKQLLQHFSDQAIKFDCDKLAWNFQAYSIKLNEMIIDTETLNFGLSHGIPSLISGLLRFDNYFNHLIFPLVRNSINLILSYNSQIILGEKTLSEFPDLYKVQDELSIKKYESRLAWCYGDLGIACALWNSGLRFKNVEWKKKAVEIILRSGTRKDLLVNSVKDAGLCHGTSGIAHIYNRFYHYTGDKRIKEFCDYWTYQTLQMAKFDDGLAGYKALYGGWRNEYGLLEGISGIGLSLLGYLYPETMDWDRCLLIS